jgi:drug/metabolite transporter (DMT)-like permease
MQLALIRGAAGAMLAVALARHMRMQVFHTRQLWLHLLRGGISLLYLWVMIYSFSRLPFADATAISYTQAAYIAVFSILILNEPVLWPRCAAAVIGILGGLLIIKPTFGDWSIVYLIALCGAGLNGLAFVLNRYLQRHDSQATTMFYSNMVMMLGNIPALATMPSLQAEVVPWLFGLFLFGPVGMYLGIVAARHAHTSCLGPFTLLRLVASVAIGIAVFSEFPDAMTFFGIAVILAGCLLPFLSWSGVEAGSDPHLRGLRRSPG